MSRRIAVFEERVGRRLFGRDSEGAHLTADGERLLSAAQQMARWAVEIERSASGWEDTPKGAVRCAAPPGFAFEYLVPLVAAAKEQLPGVQMDLITGIEHIDLTRGEADLAIRTREPTQAELVLLATFHVELGVFVAPQLAASLPKGRVSASSLPWVTWCYPMEHVVPRPQMEQELTPFTIGFASNDYLVQRRAVEAGLGAFVLPRVQHRFLPWQELVEVDTDLPLPARKAMHIVCAQSMRHVPRVRAMADLIVAELVATEGVRVERQP